MKHYFCSKIKYLLCSTSGAGIIILLIILIPLIIMVPLVAIDVNIYLLTRAQIQNSLDSAATVALNLSTDDEYRADKVLKIITNKSADNNYINGLKDGLSNNFRPVNSYIDVKGVGGDDGSLNAPKVHVFTFVPGFNFTPNPAELKVEYNMSSGKGSEYEEGDDITASHGLDGGVELTLTTDVLLPSTSKLFKFFGGAFPLQATATVRSGITGIRVLKSDDFNQSDDEFFN